MGRLGNQEWSFSKILPFYRKLENDRDAQGDFHSASGPIWIERPRADTWQPINRAFHEAARELGYADVWDHNDPRSTGVGPWPRNRRDGIRISTAIGYLNPARHRLNLTVRPFSHTNRVIVERGRATGVEVECGGVAQTIRARRVTLSAGAINSPAILMRSGIGPRAELDALGIKSVVDLPGVGRNLIDHVLVPVVATPRPGVPHDSQVTNPVGIRYTASGSNEFNDMQMYVFNFFNKSLWIGARTRSAMSEYRSDARIAASARARAGQFAERRPRRSRSYRAQLFRPSRGHAADGGRRAYRMAPDEQHALRALCRKDFVNISARSSTPIPRPPISCATIAALSIIRPARPRWGRTRTRKRWSTSTAACAASRACAWSTPR